MCHGSSLGQVSLLSHFIHGCCYLAAWLCVSNGKPLEMQESATMFPHSSTGWYTVPALPSSHSQFSGSTISLSRLLVAKWGLHFTTCLERIGWGQRGAHARSPSKTLGESLVLSPCLWEWRTRVRLRASNCFRSYHIFQNPWEQSLAAFFYKVPGNKLLGTVSHIV